MKDDNEIFVRITNKDIYQKLLDMEKKIDNVDKKTSWHTKAIAILFSLVFLLITAFAASR